MKTKFNRDWKKSENQGKKRKYKINAPNHIKSGFISSHLSEKLREKFNKRAARVRKGDTVKIMRGQFSGKTGKVERIDVKRERVYIAGVEIHKKDGSKSFYPVHPSKILITDLVLDDKKRKNALERKQEK
ncbi:50S ribosomal protein L24 [Candidatus Woesearchaeota archaeon]|nr:50S ribosomal protein L24 [Candidatus Woesearchaeota archaeon]